MSRRLAWLILAAAACSAERPAPLAEEPVPVAAVDDDPDPRTLSIRLEAREAEVTYGAGPATRAWAYDGKVPGPLIEATVGQRLVVRFENHLPEPTTIHWHGIRLPAAMDGSLAMQSPIAPGETFEYAFTLKDAGLYWYHPHVRSDVQVERGLYGAIRVRGPDEPDVDEEKILVLDDVRLRPDGSLPEHLDDASKMMGRQGNTVLVNGRANAALYVRPGAAVRFRVVNVANGRFFNLRLPGVTWRVIGTDGGLLAAPYDTERLLVAPGERYDLLWLAPASPGKQAVLTSEPYERGHHSGDEPSIAVATVHFRGDPVAAPRALPSSFPAIERLPDGPIDTPLVLGERTDERGDLAFTINDATYPDVPPISAPAGAVHVFDVRNESDMDHPFHLHGFFFQVLERGGRHTADDGWERTANKDTMIVRAGSRARIAARLDEPGMWMYHCHILEHAEYGMMGELHVH